MHDLAAKEIGDRRQPDVRMRPHVDAVAGDELGRPHLIEENERADQRAGAREARGAPRSRRCRANEERSAFRSRRRRPRQEIRARTPGSNSWGLLDREIFGADHSANGTRRRTRVGGPPFSLPKARRPGSLSPERAGFGRSGTSPVKLRVHARVDKCRVWLGRWRRSF